MAVLHEEPRAKNVRATDNKNLNIASVLLILPHWIDYNEPGCDAKEITPEGKPH
jgi:hypothetical protein